MRGRGIPVGIPSRIIPQIHDLADDYIVLLKRCIQDRNAVLVDRMIRRVLVLARIVLQRLHELLLTTGRHIAVLLVLVHRVVETAHEPTIHRTPIHDDRILLIVAAITRNGHNRIHSVGHLVHLQNVHRTRLHQRTRQTAQQVAVLVQTLGIVACVDAHGLLAHSRLVSITRRLVVIRQRNRTRHVTHNQTGVNLVMRVMGRHSVLGEGDTQRLGLRCVNVFHARLHPRGPVRTPGRIRTPHTEHWTHQTTCIRLNDDHIEQRIPCDRCVRMNPERMLGVTQLLHQDLG